MKHLMFQKNKAIPLPLHATAICLIVFVPLKVGRVWGKSLIKLVILSINSKVNLGPLI